MEYTQNPYTCKFDNSFNCLSIFIHSNYFFHNITQSFYQALSHISISTRNKLSASVILIRRRNYYARVRGCRKKIVIRKSLTVPKIVAQCQKWAILTLYTLRRTKAYSYKLPNAIAYLNTCIPYFNTCTIFLNTLTRLSALGSIS